MRSTTFPMLVDGPRLKSLRLSRNLTMKRMISRTGIGRTTMYLIERDPRHVISELNLDRLADALGLTMGELLEQAGPKARATK